MFVTVGNCVESSAIELFGTLLTLILSSYPILLDALVILQGFELSDFINITGCDVFKSEIWCIGLLGNFSNLFSIKHLFDHSVRCLDVG